MVSDHTTACVGNDPACPCQDGDACHYVDVDGSPAMRRTGWSERLSLDLLDTMTRLLVYDDAAAAKEHLATARNRLMRAWGKRQ